MFRVSSKDEFLDSDWKRFYAESDGILNQQPINDFFEEAIREAKKEGSCCCVFLAHRFDGSTFVAEMTTVSVVKKSGSRVIFL